MWWWWERGLAGRRKVRRTGFVIFDSLLIVGAIQSHSILLLVMSTKKITNDGGEKCENMTLAEN